MIVFAIRHAGRTDGDDLSPDDDVRAKLLARLLAGSGVSTAFCSTANRAKNTVQPLRDALGVRLTIKTQLRFRRLSTA